VRPADPIDIFPLTGRQPMGQISNFLEGINGLAYKPPGTPRQSAVR
jgi:hypothetical protein